MKTIQLFFIIVSVLFISNVILAQTLETNYCNKAKNKIEEAYILLHKVYTSKTTDSAKKDLQQAVKIINLAKKEMEQCPCQLAEKITNNVVQELKQYKKVNQLTDLQILAKNAMFQSRDAMLELRDDKLAQF